MQFSESDHQFMKLALQEAQTALDSGDYPVGAALVVDGDLWGTASNSLFTDRRSTAHAEHNLLSAHSSRLQAKKVRERLQDMDICLYTTLEPCLMCLGTAVMHRVSRIVVACPDPNGGTTNLDPTTLGSVYRNWWPQIETGLYRETACDLIIEFLQTEIFQSWEAMLAEFMEMKAGWPQNH